MIFSSDRTTPRSLYRQGTDGSGVVEHLIDAKYMHNASAWSADGRWLAFTETRTDTRSDLWVLPLDGPRTPRSIANSPAQEQAAVFSPDSHWIAYATDESQGRLEVIVTAFPGPGARRRVSTAGGDMPLFSKDGRQLFYRLHDQVMVVDVTTQPELSFSAPRVAFQIPGSQPSTALPFPVTRKGDAVYYVKESKTSAQLRTLTVIVNWFDELRRTMEK